MSKEFTAYLVKNSFVGKSIQRMNYCAAHYCSWLSSTKLTLAEARYKDLLNYIGHLQENKSKQVINEHLRAVSHYYRSLGLADIAYQVRVRGIATSHPMLFSQEELDHIYNNYEPGSKKGYWRYSSKLLLGFTIYQALDEGDIARLELEQLNLSQGEISVPGGMRRKASRVLPLEAHQILQLHEYISQHRDTSTAKLLSPQATRYDKLHGQIRQLNGEIRHLGSLLQMDIRRLSQLRQSKITLWIKEYGLRKAQYLAGFKRVENVERYRQQDTEDLREYVLAYHPLQ